MGNKAMEQAIAALTAALAADMEGKKGKPGKAVEAVVKFTNASKLLAIAIDEVASDKLKQALQLKLNDVGKRLAVLRSEVDATQLASALAAAEGLPPPSAGKSSPEVPAGMPPATRAGGFAVLRQRSFALFLGLAQLLSACHRTKIFLWLLHQTSLSGYRLCSLSCKEYVGCFVHYVACSQNRVARVC